MGRKKNVKLEKCLNIINYTKLSYNLMKEFNFNMKNVSISSTTQNPLQNFNENNHKL